MNQSVYQSRLIGLRVVAFAGFRDVVAVSAVRFSQHRHFPFPRLDLVGGSGHALAAADMRALGGVFVGQEEAPIHDVIIRD